MREIEKRLSRLHTESEKSLLIAYIRRFDELAKERMTPEEMLNVNEYKIMNGRVGLALRLMEQARKETATWTRKKIDAYLKTHEETLAERSDRLGLVYWDELKREKT